MDEPTLTNAGKLDLDHPDYQTVLLTTSQVAARLGISRSQVYLLLSEGKLPSVTIGRSRRILLGDLARYVARHRGAPWADSVTPPVHTAGGRQKQEES